MRVSVNVDDPGYQTVLRARALKRKVTVHLDGVEQADVFTADEDEGFVERAQKDAQGRLLSDGECFLGERVTGRVEIALVPWEPLQ